MCKDKNITSNKTKKAINETNAIRKKLPLVLTKVINKERFFSVISDTKANDGIIKNITNIKKMNKYLPSNQTKLPNNTLKNPEIAGKDILRKLIPKFIKTDENNNAKKKKTIAVKNLIPQAINKDLFQSICCW